MPRLSWVLLVLGDGASDMCFYDSHLVCDVVRNLPSVSYKYYVDGNSLLSDASSACPCRRRMRLPLPAPGAVVDSHPYQQHHHCRWIRDAPFFCA